MTIFGFTNFFPIRQFNPVLYVHNPSGSIKQLVILVFLTFDGSCSNAFRKTTLEDQKYNQQGNQTDH